MVSQHYLLARIVYPEQPQIEDQQGFNSPDEFNLLVYVKPSLTGDENELIEQYRAENPGFPHESTLDQDYSPAQFEAYRELGLHIGREIARRFAPVTDKSDWWECESTVEVGELIDSFLERQWFLKRQTRLENDYASVLIRRVNEPRLPFEERLKNARILRQLHIQANVVEGVRELAEGLKNPLNSDRNRLLIELGPLAVLPVLALFRSSHTNSSTRQRCLEVLTSALVAHGQTLLGAVEYVPRVSRELARFLIRCDEIDALRNSTRNLLDQLDKFPLPGHDAASSDTREDTRSTSKEAWALIRRLNDSRVPLAKRLEAARRLRESHRHEDLVEGVRELAEGLKGPQAIDSLLIHLGPLAVLPVLDLLGRESASARTAQAVSHGSKERAGGGRWPLP